ncbi:DUF1294 domain-containing protein [Salinarimonas ramus]|uniref:DUF1294 domain-containing protein n=1 Tax=Salinarimonas ramus TaxID=690164 RepID=UPI0016664856|nr:DUF1294 domain-containing protein [Salinarimonas ramus]
MALWLAVVNFACFLAFTLDKEAARRGAWRIRERTLLWLALLGGSPAALVAQRVLRHKTRKEPFRSQLLGIVVIHACVAAAFVVLVAFPALREPVLRAAGR